MTKNLEFKVLVKFDRQVLAWVARGVNYDIAAQSDTFEGLQLAFFRSVAAQAVADLSVGRQPFEDCPAAPEHVRLVFERAQGRVQALPGSESSEIPLPEAYQIAAQLSEMRISD